MTCYVMLEFTAKKGTGPAPRPWTAFAPRWTVTRSKRDGCQSLES